MEKIYISLGHLVCNSLQNKILRRAYYWNNMTRGKRDFISKCPTYI